MATETAEQCQGHWVKLAEQASGDYHALLEDWRKLAAACQGSGVYELRLATLHVALGEYEAARRALSSTVMPRAYQAEAQSIGVKVDFLLLLSGDNLEHGMLEQLESRAAPLAERHPELLLDVLGHLRVLLRKYASAIEPLERAAKLDAGSSLGIQRNLTIAYAYSGKYEAAAQSMERAHALSRDVTADEKFMYAATLVYAARGKPDAAKSALTIVLNKKPQLQTDPDFLETVRQAQELSGGKMK